MEYGGETMTYCISDIHGDAARFAALLDKIHFSDSDTLYVLGDVIDRGAHGVEILQYIKSSPPIQLLMGNHERMCLDALGAHSVLGAKEIWKQNGGHSTYHHLVYRCTPVERAELICFLEHLPTFVEIEVDGRAFHLVHGYPGDLHSRLWGRPTPGDPAPFHDRTTIIGHTPTCFLTNDFTTPCSVWFSSGVIGIDCGCGQNSPLSRLAALRLDDMHVYYI